MTWEELTRRQQETVRKLQTRLRAQNVSPSLSEVVQHFDAAVQWDRGELTLLALCWETGWDLPEDAQQEPGEDLKRAIMHVLETTERPDPGEVARVQHIAADVKVVKEALALLMAELKASILAADEPRGRETLVRAAEGALARRLVLEHLVKSDVLSLADRAVAQSGITAHQPYSIDLRPASGGAIQLYFSADEEEDASSATQQRAALRKLMTRLRQSGLRVESTGPHADPLEGLRARHPAVLRKQ